MKNSPTPIDLSWIQDVLEYLFVLGFIVLFIAILIAREG